MFVVKGASDVTDTSCGTNSDSVCKAFVDVLIVPTKLCRVKSASIDDGTDWCHHEPRVSLESKNVSCLGDARA